MCVEGGYKTVTPIQIANCIAAHNRDAIPYRAVRVYFACLALLAVREAAARDTARKGRQPQRESRYRLSELCALTGLKERAVKVTLRNLKDVSLVTWDERAISVNPEALPQTEILLRTLSGKRSPKRPIPVPRPVLRFVARSAKSALGKTALGYIVRGLSIDRKDAGIRSAGSVKASWIARTFGLSLRSVRSARKALIQAGFITIDTGSLQWKLNRDGAYFRVNLAWQEGERKMPKISPLGVKTRSTFSPPYKEKKTSYESKNQKAKSSALKLPGVCKANTGKEPTLTDVKLDDLKIFSRLKALFNQAVKSGWLRGSEADFLNWVAAALRATTVEAGDPVKVFVAIVRQGRWELITQAQEDRARRAILRNREEAESPPEMFHAARGTTEAVSVTLSQLKRCPGFQQPKPQCSTRQMMNGRDT